MVLTLAFLFWRGEAKAFPSDNSLGKALALISAIPLYIHISHIANVLGCTLPRNGRNMRITRFSLAILQNRLSNVCM